MKQFLLVVFMTVVGFAAGFGGRVWQEHHRPVPPPPLPILGEFGGARVSSNGHFNRAELVAEIEKIKPQIDAFTQRMNAIEGDFHTKLQAVLTDEQKAAVAERQKKREAEHSAHASRPSPDSGKPLSDERIGQLVQKPFYGMVSVVIIPLRLEELSRELKLSKEQKMKVTELLKARREQFLTLLDSVPPPSLSLSRLAPEVQRLSQPNPKP